MKNATKILVALGLTSVGMLAGCSCQQVINSQGDALRGSWDLVGPSAVLGYEVRAGDLTMTIGEFLESKNVGPLTESELAMSLKTVEAHASNIQDLVEYKDEN